MSMYGKNHYNIVISLQLIKINGKKIHTQKNRFHPHFAKYKILPSMHIYNQARLVSNFHCLIFQDRHVIASNFKANLLKVRANVWGSGISTSLRVQTKVQKEWKNDLCQQRSDTHFLISTVTSNCSFHTFINKEIPY